MASEKKNSRRRSLLGLGSALSAVALVFFGCDGKSPVAPKGQGGMGTLRLNFPKAMTLSGNPVKAMVTLPDGTIIEAEANPVSTPTATPFASGAAGAQIVLEVPVGPNRHIQLSYDTMSSYDVYGYTTLDVAPGLNQVDVTMKPSISGYADPTGGFYFDLEAGSQSVTATAGTDIRFATVFEGGTWYLDLQDPASIASAPRMVYLGQPASMPFYGLAQAPSSLSAYQGFGWGAPFPYDGAKGGTTGYIQNNDLFLVRTAEGNKAWLWVDGVDTFGQPPAYIYFYYVLGCGSDLPDPIAASAPYCP